MSTHTRMNTWWFDKKKITFRLFICIMYSSNMRKKNKNGMGHLCLYLILEDRKKTRIEETGGIKNGLFVIICASTRNVMLVHSFVSDVGNKNLAHFLHLILVAHDGSIKKSDYCEHKKKKNPPSSTTRLCSRDSTGYSNKGILFDWAKSLVFYMCTKGRCITIYQQDVRPLLVKRSKAPST